jgi:hypothetical protein
LTGAAQWALVNVMPRLARRSRCGVFICGEHRRNGAETEQRGQAHGE